MSQTVSDDAPAIPPPIKRARPGQTVTALLPPKDYWKPVWGKGGFQDIVWTPEIAQARQAEFRAEADMARALYEALDGFPGSTARVSQLGQDVQVAKLKKEPPFKHEKLLDILERHSGIFHCLPDGTVRLLPGAGGALPDAGEGGEVRESDLMLPERIRGARSIKEKLQAIRIELIHALHRRGGEGFLQELGQEPRVQSNRQGCPQAQKLSDLIRMFPGNFALNISEDGTQLVKLVGYSVSEQSQIDAVHRGLTGKGYPRPVYHSYQPQRYPPPDFQPPPPAQPPPPPQPSMTAGYHLL